MIEGTVLLSCVILYTTVGLASSRPMLLTRESHANADHFRHLGIDAGS